MRKNGHIFMLDTVIMRQCVSFLNAYLPYPINTNMHAVEHPMMPHAHTPTPTHACMQSRAELELKARDIELQQLKQDLTAATLNRYKRNRGCMACT